MAQSDRPSKGRALLEQAHVEYQRESKFGRARDPEEPGKLISLTQQEIHFVGKEPLSPGTGLMLSVNVGEEKAAVKLRGDVVNTRELPREQGTRIEVKIRKPNAGERMRLEQLIARLAGKKVTSAKLAAGTAPAGTKASVNRPVALLNLIAKLDALEVTDDLISAVMDAAESGIDLADLFTGVDDEDKKKVVKPLTIGPPRPPRVEQVTAKPLAVYRLGGQQRIFFGEDGLPVGPAANHIFVSTIKDPTCFACELQNDQMIQAGKPSFEPGDVLIFSSSAAVSDQDFVFAKTRQEDMFTQIFFGEEDVVRLRPLNGNHKEREIHRFEIRVMSKLIGVFKSY